MRRDDRNRLVSGGGCAGHIALAEQCLGKRRVRVDAIEFQTERCVLTIRRAQILDGSVAAILREPQMRAFLECVGVHQRIGRFQRFEQLRFRFGEFSGDAQLRRDQHARTRNAVRIRIDLRRLAQVADAPRRAGPASTRRWRRRAACSASLALSADAFVLDDRSAQGLERALGVTHAQIQPAQRRQFDGAFGFLAVVRVELRAPRCATPARGRNRRGRST